MKFLIIAAALAVVLATFGITTTHADTPKPVPPAASDEQHQTAALQVQQHEIVALQAQVRWLTAVLQVERQEHAASTMHYACAIAGTNMAGCAAPLAQ